jgi:hypothetical protein
MMITGGVPALITCGCANFSATSEIFAENLLSAYVSFKFLSETRKFFCFCVFHKFVTLTGDLSDILDADEEFLDIDLVRRLRLL